MSRLGLWVQIPDESWAKVWVEGETGSDDEPFTAQGTFQTDSGDEEELPDLHLRSRRRKLRTPENYTIRIAIDFAGTATAFALGEVKKPDGQSIPEVFSRQDRFRSSPVRGNAGDSKSVTLLLVTRTGPGGGVQ